MSAGRRAARTPARALGSDHENRAVVVDAPVGGRAVNVTLCVHDQAGHRVCPVRAIAGAEAVQDLLLALGGDLKDRPATAITATAVQGSAVEIALRVADHARLRCRASMSTAERVQFSFLAA